MRADSSEGRRQDISVTAAYAKAVQKYWSTGSSISIRPTKAGSDRKAEEGRTEDYERSRDIEGLTQDAEDHTEAVVRDLRR